MIRFDLLACIALLVSVACSDAPTATPAVREVKYSGIVHQPAAGGFLVYRVAGVWKLDTSGALISGTDTTEILDGSVYGISGTVLMTLKTTCVAISGKDAWSESEVMTSTSPQAFPVGGVGVLRLSTVGGVAKGGGGPKSAWYPNGNTCVDKPAAMPAYELEKGSVTLP